MKASDIDMQDLALIYDDEYGPDYVAGIMASEFPALDTDAAYEKLLGMLREAARRGEEDYPLNFLANRIAELGMKENKMRITKSQLQQVIREALDEEMEDRISGKEMLAMYDAEQGLDEMSAEEAMDELEQILKDIRKTSNDDRSSQQADRAEDLLRVIVRG